MTPEQKATLILLLFAAGGLVVGFLFGRTFGIEAGEDRAKKELSSPIEKLKHEAMLISLKISIIEQQQKLNSISVNSNAVNHK